MNPERDATRIVRSWLEDGVTGLSDRVLDNVLDQLPTTPQRRHWWQARRSTTGNTAFKFAMAAAAVVVVGVIGVNLVPGTAQPGIGAEATASPSPSPSASPSSGPGGIGTDVSRVVPEGAVPAGRYHIDVPLRDALADGTSVVSGSARLRFDLPAGWTGQPAGWAITKGGKGREMAMAPWVIGEVFLDPCHQYTARINGDLSGPPLPRDVESLAGALTAGWKSGSGFAPTSPTATTPTNATLGGLSGRYIAVTTPTDVDLTACESGQFTLWEDLNGGNRYSHGAGELNRLWVVNVGGSDPATPGGLLVIDVASQPGNTPADLEELQGIVATMKVDLLDGSRP